MTATLFREGTRALPLSVLRPADGGDCTRNGISSRFATLMLVGMYHRGDSFPMPDSPLWTTRGDYPPVLLSTVAWLGGVSAHLVPATWDDERNAFVPLAPGFMAGGNYATTGDSRLSEAAQALTGYRLEVVSIHDRLETPR